MLIARALSDECSETTACNYPGRHAVVRLNLSKTKSGKKKKMVTPKNRIVSIKATNFYWMFASTPPVTCILQYNGNGLPHLTKKGLYKTKKFT